MHTKKVMLLASTTAAMAMRQTRRRALAPQMRRRGNHVDDLALRRLIDLTVDEIAALVPNEIQAGHPAQRRSLYRISPAEYMDTDGQTPSATTLT